MAAKHSRLQRGRTLWSDNSLEERTRAGQRYQGMAQFPLIEEQADDGRLVIRDGMNPPRLALEMYGDMRLWWVLAVANGISDPVTGFIPGVEIRVPSVRYVREVLLR